jgi:hypothetical protein
MGLRLQHVYITDKGKWVPLAIGERMDLDLPGSGWITDVDGKGLEKLSETSYVARAGTIVILHANRTCQKATPCTFHVTVIVSVPPSGQDSDSFYSTPGNYDPITHP